MTDTTTTKTARKPAVKRAPAKAPARAPAKTAAPKVDDRQARVAEAADQRTHANALIDALAQMRMSREELTRRVVARGGLAGQVWRESIKGSVDDETRAFIWATLLECATERAEHANRVAAHVTEVAAPYLERASS